MEKLNQYKLELEVLRDEKESAEKEALLKAQALQAEITVYYCLLKKTGAIFIYLFLSNKNRRL